MNFSTYEIKGRHFQTNRMRTLKIDATNESAAIEQAHSLGLKTIESSTILPFESPTERQLDYATDLGIKIPEGACKLDVSALISRAVEKDGEPNLGLVEYATNKNLLFSKYIGKTALYNYIFLQLSDIDKIAFFIYSIYRYISDDRHANLDTHPSKDLFYTFASNYQTDAQFFKSLNRYSGSDLKFFGDFTTPDGWTHKGGSVDTIAFKTARNYLIENNFITESAPYRNKRLRYSSKVTYQMTDEEIEDARNNGFKVEVGREITNKVNTLSLNNSDDMESSLDEVNATKNKCYELPKYEITAVVSILVLLLVYIFIN